MLLRNSIYITLFVFLTMPIFWKKDYSVFTIGGLIYSITFGLLYYFLNKIVMKNFPQFKKYIDK